MNPLNLQTQIYTIGIKDVDGLINTIKEYRSAWISIDNGEIVAQGYYQPEIVMIKPNQNSKDYKVYIEDFWKIDNGYFGKCVPNSSFSNSSLNSALEELLNWTRSFFIVDIPYWSGKC